MSEQHRTIPCPNCRQALRVRFGAEHVRVRCVCGHDFLCASDSMPARGLLSRLGDFGAVAAVGAVLLVLALVFYSRMPTFTAEHWVSISYDGLIDADDITQSGETIAEVRSRLPQDPGAYAQLQPFMEPVAHLLPDALDMVLGPGSHPRRPVSDAYSEAGSRPAWVDLLRGGRYGVLYDGHDLATVFARGENGEAAYEAARGVLRHPLGVLEATRGGPLRVEIYAYQNDYASAALRLNTTPHVLTSAEFGPPPGKRAVDLRALEAFFEAGNELSGARIDPEDGLVLVGRHASSKTLAEHAVTAADLAVAYRAVFHAGRNDAFISLDPSADPTRVRVNFGGVLEDTRLGSVVLRADMRFKTLSSGLDPVTFADRRRTTRKQVSTFMTVTERDLTADSENTRKSGWESTRFWFYPDTVQIQSDLEGRTAYVERARFTAAAERGRDDFGTKRDFDSGKAARLSPSVRANIDDLNSRYDAYAEAFPELRELSAVAPLMGICSWLRQARAEDVDLDGLLAAELPPWSTPRDKPQMISAAVLTYVGESAPSAELVRTRTAVARIDPLLDGPIEKVFPTRKALSAFMERIGHGARRGSKTLAANGAARDYIWTKEDLRAFAEAAAAHLMKGAPAAPRAAEREMAASRSRLEQMARELAEMKQLMSSSIDAHNQKVDEYNSIVGRYEAERAHQNALVEQANGQRSTVRTVTLIEGGIDLAPKSFKMTRLQTTPELEYVRAASAEGGPGGWARSPRPFEGLMDIARTIPWQWSDDDQAAQSDATSESGMDAAGDRFWTSKSVSGGAWKERVERADGWTVERIYDPSAKQLRVAAYDRGKPQTCLLGQEAASGRIVFQHMPASGLPPLEPITP